MTIRPDPGTSIGRTLATILDENRRYAETQHRPRSTNRPRSGLAIIACMDARIDVQAALGLEPGDAHVLRNAGGLVTDDVIRSLVISQQVVGTDGILLIQHTRCGLEGADDDAIRRPSPRISVSARRRRPSISAPSPTPTCSFDRSSCGCGRTRGSAASPSTPSASTSIPGVLELID